MVLGGFAPRVLGHKGGAHGREFFIIEYALGAAFDVDGVAGVEECFGGGGSQR